MINLLAHYDFMSKHSATGEENKNAFRLSWTVDFTAGVRVKFTYEYIRRLDTNPESCRYI